MSKKPTRKISGEVEARGAELRSNLTKAVTDLKGYLNENMAGSRFRKRTWTNPGVRERDLPRFSREEAIAKGRQFVESYPLVAGMVTSMTDSIVGNGMKLSMQSGDSGLDKEIEAWWTYHRDYLDIRQIRSHGQLQRAWWTRRFVDGDIGIYKWKNVSTGERFLHTIEAERIRKQKYDYLDQGVVYDKNGRLVKAFISPRPADQMDWESMLKEGKWVGAKNFILYMNNPTERIDVLRGTSGLLTNFNALQDLVEILEAVLQKIKNEAFIGLMLYMEAGADGKLFGAAESVQQNEDGVKRRVKKMVPGMVLDLAPNEKADVLRGSTPHTELVPFIRFMMRQIGCAYGWPLELSLLDVSDTNFSGGRLIIEFAKRRVRVEQDGLGRILTNTFLWDLDIAAKRREVIVPSDWKTNNRLRRHVWIGDSLPYYDPTKEAQAAGMYLDRMLTTPQAVLAESGNMDMDDVLNGWQQWTEECKKRGLPALRGNQVATIDGEGPKSVKPQEEPEEKGTKK